MKLDLDAKEYLKYLDIICLGTISDIVPLINENRVIVKLGLRLMQETRNIGLRELIIASGYKQVNATAVSFRISSKN